MRLTIAYSKIKKRNLVLINNDIYQRETLSERPIRQPLKIDDSLFSKMSVGGGILEKELKNQEETSE